MQPVGLPRLPFNRLAAKSADHGHRTPVAALYAVMLPFEKGKLGAKCVLNDAQLTSAWSCGTPLPMGPFFNSVPWYFIGAFGESALSRPARVARTAFSPFLESRRVGATLTRGMD